MKNKIFFKATDTILLPPIMKISDNIFSAVFELMKLLPAKYILDLAEKEGLLKPGGKVIESSSGTFGLALAMLCSERNYDLTLISDPIMNTSLKNRIEDLGAKVEIVKKPEKKGGIQQARLNTLYKYLKDSPEAFWPKQYENENNPKAYEALSKLLIETLGKFDFLVAAVGSGGSSGGTYEFLKTGIPNLKLVGVDSINSVLFGRPAKKRHLRGLGGSIVPENINHRLYSSIHWVTDEEAFKSTRLLHRDHQLYMGPTSGAVYMVAKWLSKKFEKSKIVCIFADKGHRYSDTVYSDNWLLNHNLMIENIPESPKKVNCPSDAGPNWSFMDWNHRTYEDVMGKCPPRSKKY